MHSAINFRKIIYFLMFLYIFSLYFLTQREIYNIVSNAIAGILFIFIWIDHFLNKRRININAYIIGSALFVFIILVSVLYASNASYALSKSISILLLFILAFSINLFIIKSNDIIKIKKYFLVSGFFLSIYLIINMGLLNGIRVGSAIGNENIIGMISVVSFTIGFTEFLFTKKYRYIALLLPILTLILLTGSRKSILFLLISIFLSLFLYRNMNIKQFIKIAVITFVLFYLIVYTIYNVQSVYNIVGSRIDNLIIYLKIGDVQETSIRIRQDMLNLGLYYFRRSPFIGFGIDNFRLFYSQSSFGEDVYSHSNLIELLVGVGLIGTFVFYITYGSLVYKFFKFRNQLVNYKHILPLTIIVLGYMISSLYLVFYYDKVFIFIASTLASGIYLTKKIQ